jgi:hypothetical protein
MRNFSLTTKPVPEPRRDVPHAVDPAHGRHHELPLAACVGAAADEHGRALAAQRLAGGAAGWHRIQQLLVDAWRRGAAVSVLGDLPRRSQRIVVAVELCAFFTFPQTSMPWWTGLASKLAVSDVISDVSASSTTVFCCGLSSTASVDGLINLSSPSRRTERANYAPMELRCRRSAQIADS